MPTVAKLPNAEVYLKIDCRGRGGKADERPSDPRPRPRHWPHGGVLHCSYVVLGTLLLYP